MHCIFLKYYLNTSKLMSGTQVCKFRFSIENDVDRFVNEAKKRIMLTMIALGSN